MSLIRQTTDQPEVVEVPPRECECEAKWPGGACIYHENGTPSAVGVWLIADGVEAWLCSVCGRAAEEFHGWERIQ